MKKLLLMLMLSLGFFATSAVADNMQTFSVTSDKPSFTVTLKSNPTTGYRWFIQQYDRQLLTLTKHVYEAPTTTRMGAGGVEMWTFAATPLALRAPQRSEIILIYARPWEKQRAVTTEHIQVFTQ